MGIFQMGSLSVTEGTGAMPAAGPAAQRSQCCAMLRMGPLFGELFPAGAITCGNQFHQCSVVGGFCFVVRIERKQQTLAIILYPNSLGPAVTILQWLMTPWGF